MNSYIGHPSQLSGVEEYRLIGGKGDGMRLLQVRNGLAGVHCLSGQSRRYYQALLWGVNYSYISPSGYVAPAYYDQQEFGFLKSFTCGFLTTCGLSNIGVLRKMKAVKRDFMVLFPIFLRITYITQRMMIRLCSMLPYQMEKFSSRSLCSIGNWYVARRKQAANQWHGDKWRLANRALVYFISHEFGISAVRWKCEAGNHCG